jgi:HSP20 family protein
MPITKWNPWGELSTLQERINRLFTEAFPQTAGAEGEVTLGAWNPVVDIFDGQDAIVIHVELPGVKKNDISVEIKDNMLILKGERSLNNEVKEEDYYRKERSFGSFQRAFTLPAPVDPEKIKATYKGGVLEIKLEKPEIDLSKKIKVEIK